MSPSSSKRMAAERKEKNLVRQSPRMTGDLQLTIRLSLLVLISVYNNNNVKINKLTRPFVHHQTRNQPKLSMIPSNKQIVKHTFTKFNIYDILTPIGLKNKNDANGRLGACNPALDILTASLKADKTRSWPTTLFLSESSICP